MLSITVNHEYKEMGTLCLISGSNLNNGTPESGFDHFFSDTKDDIKSYWLRVNFEHVSTGATYCANFDDGQIRGFCAILKFDPELLNDFIANKPELKIQQENIIVEFNLQVVSKVYSFNIQIPKYISTGSPTEVVELRQQNNVLIRRIKTLEDRLTNIETMFAKSQMGFDIDIHSQMFYIDTCGENPKMFEPMINDIMYVRRPNYDITLELLKKGKMPQFKQYIIDNKKQNMMYQYLMTNHLASGCRIDTLFDFCQLEIKIDCPYTGSMCNHGGGSPRTYSSLLEHFDFYSSTYHTNIISSCNNTGYNYSDPSKQSYYSPLKKEYDELKQKSEELLNSPDFLRKRTETRNLIIKIQT